MLVPLTGSLYVPGTLASVSDLLVDVGTGYYISKSVEGAKEFLEKKVRFTRPPPRVTALLNDLCSVLLLPSAPSRRSL